MRNFPPRSLAARLGWLLCLLALSQGNLQLQVTPAPAQSAFQTVAKVLKRQPLWRLGLAITVVMQLCFFLLAFALQFDKLTDLAGTLNFAVLALLSLQRATCWRQKVLAALVCVWALRLGSFLFYRVLKRKKDARFDAMRSKFFSFLGFWCFQMAWVWTVSLPLLLLEKRLSPALGWQDYLGWALWALGLLLEASADHTKLRFKATKPAAKAFIQHGPWAWSRHPNYAGEILLWVGIALSAAAGLQGWRAYACGVSPAFTAALLLLLSGVNLAEQRAGQRYGNDPAYQAYRKRTSPLVPLPSSWYKRLPQWVKRTFLFEWRRYAQQGTGRL